MKILVTHKQQRALTSRMLLWEKKVFTALFLLLGTLFCQAQSITVKGRVTNESGQGVPSASVTVKGTSEGVTTNTDGSFQILAPSQGTLVISSIGFSTIEVSIKGRTTINTVLRTTGTTMEQVVVIGYGTQRKEAVTGSVASISGDAIREVPAPNVSQALQGRLPGVEISQTSTKPGATMQIRIRGQRSLTASNDPLIVLDGIPFIGSIGDLNATDIKSVDVLKDASATAIYGSRGANGVILITTNRGQKGKPKILYNGYYGAQTLFAKYPMMNGPEFVKYRKLANKYSNGADEADTVNTDWQDLFYRPGYVTSQNLSVLGGTESSSYHFGGEYYQNQSVIPTQKYTRYSLQGSVDQQIGKLLRVGFTSNSNYNLGEGNQVGLYGTLSMSPIANPYNPDGSLKRTVKMPLDEQYVYTRGVVEGLHDQWLSETRNFATYNSIYGEVKIPWVDGLKYRVNLGLDFIQSNTGNYTGTGVTNTTASTPSSASVSNAHTYHWTVENLLTYDHTFAKKHNINVVGLYSTEQNKYNSSSQSAKDIAVESFQFYNLGASLDPNSVNVSGTYNLRGLISGMGRVMYSYDNRYMLSATVRSDASSVLAEGHKWHTYPALSVGWNISNESFMKNITFIDRLKLRAGYGQTSNQSINPYQTLGTLGTRYYNFGDNNYQNGYYVSQLPNQNLGWEYSENWNYALEFSVLKNRLSGTAEYYITNTNDLLLSVNLPVTSGVTSYLANIGKTQNKGFEFSLNGTILDNKNGWTWDAGINVYTNKNKLVALATGQTRDEGNAWFVGHNIDAIYDYKKIGLWTDSKDSAAGYLNTLVPGGNVGMIKVLYTGTYDANGKPTRAIGTSPGADDRQIMDVDPNFEGGFNTRVSYKGFDLSMVGIFKSGGILISNLYGPNGYLNLLTGRRGQLIVDYWTTDNPGAKYPKPGGIQSGDNPMYSSTLAYFDASYLKVRTITLGYDFSRKLIKTPDVKLRMYFTVQNPFVLFSPYNKESGMDPETNSYGNDNVATGGYQRRILTVGFNTPSTRNYIVGINMTL